MTLTEYFRAPRVITRAELAALEAEIAAISARADELEDSDPLLEHFEGRLDAIVMILDHSLKLTEKAERRAHLRVVC